METATLETKATLTEELYCETSTGNRTSTLIVRLTNGRPRKVTLQHSTSGCDTGTLTLLQDKGGMEASLWEEADQCERLASMFSEMAEELCKRGEALEPPADQPVGKIC